MTALLLLWLPCASVSADELATRAHKAEEALDYDEAARFWLEVLALPELPAHRRVEAHVQLATAFAVLGDQEGARTHFRRALTEEPTAKLPPHAPAKVKVLFEDVSMELAARASEQRDQGPWVAATVALTAGVATAVTSTVLLALAAVADSEALAEPAQVRRAAIYDRRDALFYGGEVAAVGSAALLVASGAAWIFVAMPQPGE